MPATSGRGLLIKKGGTAIAGAKEDGISLDGSPVDITSKSDAGFRTLATFSGAKAIDLSISGVWINKTFRDAVITQGNSLYLTDITVTFADGGSLAGDFFVSSYEETGVDNDAVKFTATLQSSESWTYTTAV